MDVVKQLEDKLATAKVLRDAITETDKLLSVLENRPDVHPQVVLEVGEGVRLPVGGLYLLGFSPDDLILKLHERRDNAQRQLAKLV